MIEYICSRFPQAVGVPLVDPPLRALFESFFAPAPHSQPTLAFSWFAQVQQAIIDADSCLAALTARSFPLVILLMRFVARMPLAVRFQ